MGRVQREGVCLSDCAKLQADGSTTYQANKDNKHTGCLVQAWLAVNLTADLQDSFTWNTRQIYLWLTAEYKTEKNQLNQAVFWNWIIESKVRRCKL